MPQNEGVAVDYRKKKDHIEAFIFLAGVFILLPANWFYNTRFYCINYIFSTNLYYIIRVVTILMLASTPWFLLIGLRGNKSWVLASLRIDPDSYEFSKNYSISTSSFGEKLYFISICYIFQSHNRYGSAALFGSVLLNFFIVNFGVYSSSIILSQTIGMYRYLISREDKNTTAKATRDEALLEGLYQVNNSSRSNCIAYLVFTFILWSIATSFIAAISGSAMLMLRFLTKIILIGLVRFFMVRSITNTIIYHVITMINNSKDRVDSGNSALNDLLTSQFAFTKKLVILMAPFLYIPAYLALYGMLPK
jgi:hypothetical protein